MWRGSRWQEPVGSLCQSHRDHVESPTSSHLSLQFPSCGHLYLQEPVLTWCLCWHPAAQGQQQQSCRRGDTSPGGHWLAAAITQDTASLPNGGTSSTSFGMIYHGVLLLNNITLFFLFIFSRVNEHSSQTSIPAACFPSPWTTGLTLAL